MPKGIRLKISDEQRAKICSLAQQGLRASAILELRLEVLAGLNAGAIQRVICKAGLAGRLTAQQEKQVVDFLSGEGKSLPDASAAEELARTIGPAVTKGVVYRLRRKYMGEVGGRRYSARTEKERNKKHSQFFAKQRAKLCKELGDLQTKMEKEGCREPLRTCKLCGDKRFATADFFYAVKWYKGHKAGGLAAICKVCELDRKFFIRLGKKMAEIHKIMGSLYFLKPKVSQQDLRDLMRKDTLARCPDALVACQHCRALWFWNKRYFHSQNGKTLLGSCLACPAKRQFFFKS